MRPMKLAKPLVVVGLLVRHISNSGISDSAGQLPEDVVSVPTNSNRSEKKSYFSNFHDKLYRFDISRIDSRYRKIVFSSLEKMKVSSMMIIELVKLSNITPHCDARLSQ